jgi:membrane protease YdiL (CAAX protease family)
MYLITILLTFLLPGIISAVILMIYMLIVTLQSGLDGLQGIGNILDHPFTLLVLVGIYYTFSFLFFYIAMRFIHKRSLISVITIRPKINWRRIFKGAALWVSILAIFTIITLFIDPGIYKFTFKLESFIILLILSLIIFPVQSFFEELFFRGYLMQGFGILSKKPVIPLLATSIIFASLHWFNSDNFIFSLLILFNTFIVGLMLGIITLGENSIETAAGIHIANNLYVSLIVNIPDAGLGDLPSVFSAPLDPASNILGTVLAVLITLIIIFWGKKDKLMDIVL